MKFLRFLLMCVFFLAVIVCVVPAFLDSSGWDVQVQAKVKADPSAVYEEVAELPRWKEWSTWAEQEGGELRFEGPSSGPGAKLHWSMPMYGEKKSVGTITITEVDPGKSITYECTMEDGQGRSTGVIEFSQKEGSDETKVLWKDVGHFMDGDDKVEGGAKGYFFRYMGWFMQTTLTDGFGKNLESLKSRVEKAGA